MHALMKHADAAMYEAKASGKNQYKFFLPAMDDRVKARFSIEARLRRAIEREEFSLFYQPQINLNSGSVVGIEALLRWDDPEFGMHMPHQFIPIAEETGLIVQIGHWVLHRACEQARRLQNAGHTGLTVSVNLSPRQLATDVLITSIKSAISRARISPSSLKLEVTENMLMEHPEQAAQVMNQIHQMGIGLSIDDFGIGYSNLSFLQRYPVHQLKIDQSFIRQVAEDHNDAAITRAVITLGHSLKLKIVAEGVFAKSQLDFLRAHSCDEVQGNYFCAAVPFDELKSFLDAHH